MNQSRKILPFDLFVQVAILCVIIIWVCIKAYSGGMRGLRSLEAVIMYYFAVGLWNFFANVLHLYFQRKTLKKWAWRKIFLIVALLFLFLTPLFAFSTNDRFVIVALVFSLFGGAAFALTYLVGTIRELRRDS